MKHFLTLFVMLLFFQSYGQDLQWYILNNHCIDTPGNHSSSPDYFRTCNILGVDHPFRPGPSTETPRNDLFIIFNSGNHFNSKYLDLDTDWVDYDSGLTAPNNTNYFLITDSDISHLYYTNVYEGDEEPTAMIVPFLTPPTTTPSYLQFKAYGTSNPITNNSPLEPITFNHTPVPGKDLTLIIDHNSVDAECVYSLCYNITSPENKEREKSSNSFPISESQIFGSNPPTTFIASGGGASILTPINGTLTENCINNITFSANAAYTYVNFNLAEDPDSTLAFSDLEFSLTGPGCNPVAGRDTIKNSHDPNFVKVNCVSRVQGEATNTVHYTAQCMNDGYDDQDHPSIELTFPFNVTPADIIITEAKIRSKWDTSVYNQQAPVMCNPAPNRIMFQFCGNLDYCPPPSLGSEECIAWVKFCVKVDSSYNVLTENLQPFDRNTNFGDDPYIIDRYIPLPCDSIFKPDTSSVVDPNIESEIVINNPNNPKDSTDFKNEEIGNPQQIVSGSWACIRKNTPCECESKVTICPAYQLMCDGTPNWKLIWGIIIILLLLLWWFSKYFRKRSKG